MAIPSISAIKLNYLGSYCGMAVNYHGKKFYNIGPRCQNLNTAVVYYRILTLENVGISVNHCTIFITLAPYGIEPIIVEYFLVF